MYCMCRACTTVRVYVLFWCGHTPWTNSGVGTQLKLIALLFKELPLGVSQLSVLRVMVSEQQSLGVCVCVCMCANVCIMYSV